MFQFILLILKLQCNGIRLHDGFGQYEGHRCFEPGEPDHRRKLAEHGVCQRQKRQAVSLNGAVYAFSLANPILPVVENSLAVPPPAPSASLDVSQLSFPAATWVGNYLIGMMYGSAASYNGARALPFTVNQAFETARARNRKQVFSTCSGPGLWLEAYGFSLSFSSTVH